MTEDEGRFSRWIADTIVRLTRGVPLALIRHGGNRWLRVKLDGSPEARATLARAAATGTLVGVYDCRCHRQWLEEDVRWVESQSQA